MKELAKGLFRKDLKNAKVVSEGEKFGIEVEYMSGEKELLSVSFDSPIEAQNQVDALK